jgi:hypothetical protein
LFSPFYLSDVGVDQRQAAGAGTHTEPLGNSCTNPVLGKSKSSQLDFEQQLEIYIADEADYGFT